MFEAFIGAGPGAFSVALAVTVVAGLMRGFVGVGSGMLMAPVFAIVFGPLDTVAMILMLEVVVTAQLLPSVHRRLQWRTIAPMGCAAMLSMPLGTWLLVTLDPQLMTRAIAVVVIVAVALMATGWRYHGPKRMPATIGVGALSGVLMAATSLGNPPVMVYLLSGADEPATNRANFTGYFAITLVALLAWMTIRGLIGSEAVLRAAVLLPAFMLAAWAGARAFRVAGQQWYRRVALGLLLVVALLALLR